MRVSVFWLGFSRQPNGVGEHKISKFTYCRSIFLLVHVIRSFKLLEFKLVLKLRNLSECYFSAGKWIVDFNREL